MNQAAAAAFVPLEAYFEAEVGAGDEAVRHEWFDGVVYAMSRGTPEHGRLTARAIVALGNGLPGECQVYSSDTMLFVAAANLVTYADAIVVCGALETVTARDRNARSIGQAVTNPTVVVEVLSESTERYDRDGKFQAYKQIASLREYVLISQEQRRIEVFRRAEDWRGEVGAPGGTVRVHGGVVEVDRIYGS